MNRLTITPAKRRFGRKPRRQWKFALRFANGRQLSGNDSYANPQDIIDAVRTIRDEPLKVEIHYDDRVEAYEL